MPPTRDIQVQTLEHLVSAYTQTEIQLALQVACILGRGPLVLCVPPAGH